MINLPKQICWNFKISLIQTIILIKSTPMVTFSLIKSWINCLIDLNCMRKWDSVKLPTKKMNPKWWVIIIKGYCKCIGGFGFKRQSAQFWLVYFNINVCFNRRIKTCALTLIKCYSSLLNKFLHLTSTIDFKGKDFVSFNLCYKDVICVLL